MEWRIWNREKIDWKREIKEYLEAIIVAIIIYFAFKYILVFALGANPPFAVVVSGSMHHSEEFDSWWQYNAEEYARHGIDEEMFTTFPSKNGFSRGDIVIIKRDESIEVGDIIVFKVPSMSVPIVHRVVRISEEEQRYYLTKGDANGFVDTYYWGKDGTPEDEVIGRVVLVIPKLGYPSIWLKQLLGMT